MSKLILIVLISKAERRRKEKGSSPLQDEPEEEILDDETQALDAVAMERIRQIIHDYQEEMNNFELKKEGTRTCLCNSKNNVSIKSFFCFYFQRK